MTTFEVFEDALFWLARALENFNEAITDYPDLLNALEAAEDYESLGYPLGKSKRGFKKWRKRNPYGVLHSNKLIDKPQDIVSNIP